MSIVIPLYNAVEVVAETIQSALDQTWTDREIVVVDDGSTDGSDEVIRIFGDQVRYHRFANSGVAKARNRGISLSRGKYIALLDHDDLWEPTKLEKQVHVLDSRPEVGLVYTGIMHLGWDGRPREKFPTGPSSRFYQLFVKGFGPTPSAAMLRRSVLDQAGGFDERFCSAGLDDHEFWPRIALHCEIALIDQPLTSHRHRKIRPPQIELSHRILLNTVLMERFGHDPAKRQYLLEERVAYLADLGKWRLSQGDVIGGQASLQEALGLCLEDAWNGKMAWRAASRLARSYIWPTRMQDEARRVS